MSAADMTPSRTTSRATTSAGALVSCALALLVTGVVWALGRIGAPIRVITGWSPEGAALTLTEVWLTALLAIVLGSWLLHLWQRRTDRAWRRWLVTVAMVAVVSAVPLWRLDVDTGSKMALTVMHLLTGVCAVAGHAVARRRHGAT